ncbi:MAG: FISUMP domain-containing protein [Bacteroidales bacterium]|nr:FISUMP domain-containing protein [Bacteroidales bacterium]
MGKTKFNLFAFCTLLLVGCGKDPVDTSNGTFKDSRDQHVYNYVKIGTQTWMAENLAYLPAVSPSSEGSETSPFYYVYDYEGNSAAAAKETANYLTYGALYNWEAAKIACPSGWHLPTDAEWTALTNFLGSSAGGLMKENGTFHWGSPNSGATNASGFTALPGGGRYKTGEFVGLGDDAYFWSSSEDGAFAWNRYLIRNGDGVTRYFNSRNYGLSVRCLQD